LKEIVRKGGGMASMDKEKRVEGREGDT